MKNLILLILFCLSSFAGAQNNIYLKNKNHYFKFGNFKYSLEYEYFHHPEEKIRGYAEVLLMKNKKQYISNFVYQLKSDTEIMISPDHPPRPQLENKIIQSSNSEFDYQREQIIVTSYYYDEKEPKEKEIKTLQQSKKGFFYVKQKQIYYRNGDIKEEKDFPKKIEFMKTSL